MKFELYRTPERRALMLPPAVMKLAGVESEEKLCAHVESGAVVVLREKMTAKQMACVIGSLSELATAYTVRLASASGFCDDCGLCEDEEADACGGCAGLSIPPCYLKQAGIPVSAGLEVGTESGKVVVTAETVENDPLEELPALLTKTLRSAGVCLESFRRLLESGESIDE